jgi:uncharacterized protein (DUF427 family)
MAKASWKNAIIAESNEAIVFDGNHYFPPASLKDEFFSENAKKTVCGWKGECNYMDVIVDGETNQAAAWVYRNPKPEAEQIRGYVAFWNGVSVSS